MSYNKRIWANGDLITKERMNNIEDGIYNAHEEINTLKNNTSTGGSGGAVDLSGYVTKEVGNANQITFSDGQTFQSKLNAGLLKGDKGEQGIQGLKGDKGDKGTDGQTPNITIGTVTTLEAGSNATASITGTTPNLALNLGIPKGADGSSGGSPITGNVITLGNYIIQYNETDDTLDFIYTGTITSYSITNKLSNCSTSNNNTSIEENNAYSARITANTGYTLTGATISITMGGVDITSTVYSNGDINIPDVTGDVVINISAVSATSEEVITPTWEVGNIYAGGNNNDGDSTALRTTNIERNSSYNYTITPTSEFEGISNIKVYFYTSDGTFISRTDAASLGITTAGTATKITFPSNTASFRVKVDVMTGNSVSNMNNRLIIKRSTN